MRVLITGASGMLGATLVEHYQEFMNIYATGNYDFRNNKAKNFKEFDLAEESFGELIDWAKPDVIIHCAAIINVNLCEEEKDHTLCVNGYSVKKFMDYAPKARIIYISSDAVFADEKYLATELEPPSPNNIYGKSKVLGEHFIKETEGAHCAIRTTIVGRNLNPSKQSFTEWIINTLVQDKAIDLFCDVIFTPIAIWHLAEELKWIIDNPVKGVFHVTGIEPISKYDFGFKLCKNLGLNTALIRKASIGDFPLRAGRSKDQTLDSTLYESMSQRKLPNVFDTIDILTQKFKTLNYV